MKKLIMESLLVFAMLIFLASSAMAEKPEDVIDNSNVLPSNKKYALNITGKSCKGKKATATTERQAFDPYISASDVDDDAMEQLRMILFLMCCQEPGKLYR